ncbi:hypothetical protein ACLS0S_06410 [Glaesserella parasuis]|nr:hypothetical protein [Glaesserella parasuis]MDE4016426.1 hypothetical protein [Glaesserella parasuis]
MSNLTPFSQTLSKLNRGELNDELTDVLQKSSKPFAKHENKVQLR